MNAPSHLFFYGVLLEALAQWPFLRGLGSGQPAATRGMLHAIPDAKGWYPALTPGDGRVRGMLHEIGSADLYAIDAFEGQDYQRGGIKCEPAPSTAAANVHAYLWVARLPNSAVLIEHGDFALWIRQNGYQVFQPT